MWSKCTYISANYPTEPPKGSPDVVALSLKVAICSFKIEEEAHNTSY